MTERRRPPVRPWALALVLAAVAVAVYAPVRSHGFLTYDDPGYVTANAEVRAGLTTAGVRWAFATGSQGNWHPLTWLSHMADVSLFGVRPGPHHLTSAVLHGASAGLLLLALAAATGRLWRPAVVAGLFALHPLHVESVAWIAERKDVLSGLFAWATVLAWVWWIRRPSSARYLLAAALFAAGLLAKPMLVTLPFVLLLLDVWPLRRLAPPAAGPSGGGPARSTWTRLVLEKVPLLALSVASSIVTFSVQRAGGAMQDGATFPVVDRVANAAVGYVTYLRRAVWPDDLAFFHPYPSRLEWTTVAAALAVLAAVSVAAWRLRRGRPWVAVGWCWFLGTLVPVIGLVQVGTQATADRYAYIPLVGIWLILVWGAAEIGPRSAVARRVRAGVALLILSLCAVATRHTLAAWRDSETLYRRALAVTSDNYVAHTMLALELVRGGRPGEAERNYREAVRLRPDFAIARNNYGILLADLGRYDEAIDHYRAALRVRPGYLEAVNNLAVALASTGRSDEAASLLRQALDRRPDNPEAAVNLALLERRAGRPGEAIRWLRHAVDLRPEWRDEDLELAWLLATAPDAGVRDGAEAVRRAERRCAERVDARCLDVLAAGLAEVGRFDEARATAERAAALAHDEGRPELERAIRGRLEGYPTSAP